MKKLLLASGILVLLFQVGLAQKYKVKRRDGTVSKDKEEVARVEGKVTMFKPSYMDMYQNDELVLSLKEKNWSSIYKEFKGFPYYELEFPQLGEKFSVRTSYTLTNEKQIINYLLADNGLHIYKDGFKEEEIERMKNSKAVSSIRTDTSMYLNLLSEWKEALAEDAYPFNDSIYDKVYVRAVHTDVEKRPKNLPDGITHLLYRQITDEEIIRDYKAEEKSKYKLVGALSYKNAEPEIGQMKGTYEIRVFRRLNKSVEYNGKETMYAPLAYTDLNEFGKGLNGGQGENQYILYTNGSVRDYVPSQKGDNTPISFAKRADYLMEDLKSLDLI